MIEQILFYWKRYGFLALIRKIYQKYFKVTIVHRVNPVEFFEQRQLAFTPFVFFADPQETSRLTLVTELESRNYAILDLTLLLSVSIAKQWEVQLRVISPRETSKYRFSLLMHACGINYKDNIDFRSLENSNAGKPLEVSSDEIFMATGWQIVWKLMSCVNDKQIIYLVHEQPELSAMSIADKTNYLKVIHNYNIHFIFVTRTLYELYADKNNTSFQQNVWLDADSSFNPLTENASASTRWKNILNGITGYLDKVKTNASA